MILFAGLCIGLGVWPEFLYAMLPYPVTYVPYTVTHVVNMLQLLMFSGFAFFIMLPLMKRTLTITLDFDWFYRRVFPGTLQRSFSIIWKADQAIRQAFLAGLNQSLSFLSRRYEGTGRTLNRMNHTGSMVMWVAVILATYLLLSFIH